jgi:hypothetical protein
MFLLSSIKQIHLQLMGSGPYFLATCVARTNEVLQEALFFFFLSRKAIVCVLYHFH